MKLSIGLKLAFGFLSIILLLGASGWWAYRTLNQQTQRYDALLTKQYPLALATQGFNAEIQTQSQLTMAYAATRDDRLAEVKAARDRAGTYLAQLRTAAEADPELAQQVDVISERLGRFNTMVDGVFQNGGTLSNQALVFQSDNARAIGEAIGVLTNKLVEYVTNGVESQRRSVAEEARNATVILMLVILFSAMIGIMVSVIVYRAVTAPLRTVTSELRAISQGAGDLTRKIRVTSRDELGDLAESFNQLVSSLAGMVRQVIASSHDLYGRSQILRKTTDEVAQGTSGVHLSVNQVAQGAAHQAQQTISANTIMGELGLAISQIAAGAQQQTGQMQHASELVTKMVQAMDNVAHDTMVVATASQDAADTAAQGARIVDDTVAGMERMRSQVLGAAEKITELGTYGSKIGEIMVVITEIANQTNLLALNAAIEAARAGEAGRGFAVVADEVRKLASRAGTSAQQIGILIKSIQRGTEDAVEAIQSGTREVEHSRKLAEDAGQALVAILTAVDKTSVGARNISEAAQEVAGYSRQVAQVVEEVAAITEENSAATEEMAAGADEVRTSIQGVSSVAELNSAAVEQVSATMSQVSESVEHIATSTQELAAIAAKLQNLVGQFKVQ